MKGFVLTGVLHFLEKQFDEELVFELMDTHGMPTGGIYSPIADYPDTALNQLIERAAELLEMQFSKLSKILGVGLFSELLSLNPRWVTEAKSTFELLKSHDVALNKTIENAFPGFVAPSFSCLEINQDILEVNYKSLFLPADVAQGLIAAAIVHYNENFYVELIKHDPPVDFNLQFVLRRKCDSRVETD